MNPLLYLKAVVAALKDTGCKIVFQDTVTRAESDSARLRHAVPLGVKIRPKPKLAPDQSKEATRRQGHGDETSQANARNDNGNAILRLST